MSISSGMQNRDGVVKSFFQCGALLFCVWCASAHATYAGEIVFSESKSEQAVTVAMALTPCAKEVRFVDAIPGGRRRTWQLQPPWRWADDLRAESEECTGRIAFSTTEADLGGDREYPFLLRSGAGTHVYLPYLRTRGQDGREKRSSIVRTGCAAGAEAALTRYVLVAGCVQANTTVTVDQSAPSWLADLIKSKFRQTSTQAAALFGNIDGSQVRLYVNFMPSSLAPSWRGWTSGPELFLNFYGNWSDTPELRYEAEKYLTHEVLHLWNGWKRQAGDTTPQWLAEGYAEFFALELMRARGSISGADVQRAVEDRATRCLAVGHSTERAPDLKKLSGEAVYDCGVMAVYVMDRSLGSQSLAEAASPWRRVFGQYPGTEISLGEVLRAYHASPVRAKPSVESTSEHPEMPGLDAPGLKRLGAVVSMDESSVRYAAAAREALLQGLVQQFCTQPPFGFSSYPSYIELDTGSRCGRLSGDPKIVGVQGASIFGDAAIMGIRAAIEDCNAGGSVKLHTQDGSELAVVCKSPISMAPALPSFHCLQGALCDITHRNANE